MAVCGVAPLANTGRIDFAKPGTRPFPDLIQLQTITDDTP